MSDTTRGSTPIPPFDRTFGPASPTFARIGEGALGGKATGLAFIHDAITTSVDPAAFGGIAVDIPRLVVVATDVYEKFVVANGLLDLPLDELSDVAIAHAFQQGELPVEIVGDLRALVEQARSPLAVRSSSLLEDALEHPFAGVYATKMIPNNAYDADTRFRRLVEALKFVWASTLFSGARAYIRTTGRDPRSERMAVIVQEVAGRGRGPRWYPDLAGVARSYNFYPRPNTEPADGVVNLALGLGKTIVDGGVSWSYSPARPQAAPPFASMRACLRDTQTSFWAVNMGPVAVYDPVDEVEYLVEGGLAEAEDDGALRFVASTYDAARDALTPGIGPRGPRVLTFAPLLVYEEFPLNALVRELLRLAEARTGAKVEIEFALTIDQPRGESARARFAFLQVRPMALSSETVEVAEDDLVRPDALLGSDRVMGNGIVDDIHDIVYVKPGTFEVTATPSIAAELQQVDRPLQEAGRPYLLVGFGRWGSSHTSLGIPVAWSQIAGARAIVETTLPEMNVEPSQGSHFFHNLTSFKVSYFTLHHDGPYRIDWAWLEGQPATAETEHVRAVRTDVPLRILVDGRSGRGVVLRGTGR